MFLLVSLPSQALLLLRAVAVAVYRVVVSVVSAAPVASAVSDILHSKKSHAFMCSAVAGVLLLLPSLVFLVFQPLLYYGVPPFCCWYPCCSGLHAVVEIPS
jgi:hypothetical protein